ncbi:MAG: ribosome maturation factor RimM [Erysipelotrichaceae bacterium]|nr:ribosome maturation factor RimM [Erysipelotrichaceae bacterium]MDY5252690.1 ribosome maturation factor RimM [Erysipelotrichaceae bacterium]
MEYIKIGTIVNTFGIKGELKIKSYTDFEEERFAIGNTVYVLFEQQYLPFIVGNYRYHKQNGLLSFAKMADINLVEKYKGCDLFITNDSLHQLAPGEYYFFQLKDLQVYDMDNKHIGKVLQVEEGLAHNNLRIELLDGKKCMVPYVKAFIHKVDLDRQKIWIKTIEGLL